MPRYAIIVDPLSTGREYPAAFRAEGVLPIAVLSTPEPVEVLKDTWHPENFEAVHYHDGDLSDGAVAALAATLRAVRPALHPARRRVGHPAVRGAGADPVARHRQCAGPG